VSNIRGDLPIIRRVASSPNVPFSLTSRTDQIDLERDEARNETLRLFIPLMQRMSKNSVSFDRRMLYFYQKLTSGRRCSCFLAHDAPDGGCQICFKTGFVGGYDKFGCKSEYLDASSTLELNGCRIEYNNRPHTIELVDGSVEGTIFGEFEVLQNVGVLDTWQLSSYQPSGSLVKAFIKADSDLDYVEVVDSDTLESRLNSSVLKFKIELSRANTELRSPKFSHFFTRYNLRTDLQIPSDWPKISETISLSDYGIYDAWQSYQINLDHKVKKIGPEDFFVYSYKNTRWKVTDETPQDPMESLIGHEVTVRLIQDFEPYFKVP